MSNVTRKSGEESGNTCLDLGCILAIILFMKLIDEIKKAEEEAEQLKKNAEIEGQKLIEGERECIKKDLAALEQEKEKLLKKSLQEAKMAADEAIKKLQMEYKNQRKKIENLCKRNKEKAVKKVQEIIIKWPLSQ